MKKALVVVLAITLLLGSITSASASCTVQPTTLAMSDGGGSTSRNTNTTKQTGGVNQSATVQGNDNAVNIKQVVNAGDSYTTYRHTTVNNVTVVQVVEPTPAPHVDYSKLKATITVYGEAFLEELSRQLCCCGWKIITSVETVQTHNYVVSIKFVHVSSGFISGSYKLLFYTVDHESYTVALSTAYHAGWRIKDYPESQIIFRGCDEIAAIENIKIWIEIVFGCKITSTGTGCHCCPNCNCTSCGSHE